MRISPAVSAPPVRAGADLALAGDLVTYAARLVLTMRRDHDSKTVLVVGVVVAGAFLGVTNTVITEAVMGAAPVERPVASAAYSFVRFSGGAVAPYVAGRLSEDVSVHAPFWMGAGVVALAVAILATGARFLRGEEVPAEHSRTEGDTLAVADLD